MGRPTRVRAYGQNLPLIDVFPFPIYKTRAPTATDRDFEIGQVWVFNSSPTTRQSYLFGGLNDNQDAIWMIVGPGDGELDTLTGNTGGPVGPTAGNINIIGDGPISVSGAGSTLTINANEGGFPITPYVVGPVGEAGYQTIQAAINAIGGNDGFIAVQPGTYTENLTFINSANVQIFGEGYNNTTITGLHNPPSLGSVVFRDINLTSATDIFSSLDVGQSELTFDDCTFNVTDGYIFNLENWQAALTIYNCADFSTNCGVINNSIGCPVEFSNSNLGAGTGKTLTYAGGEINIEGTDINCPVSLGPISTLTAILATTFSRTVTTANDAICIIANSYFSTGSASAISHGSSGTFLLSNVTINSSNANAIAGTGAGVMTMVGVCFTNSSTIAATLTTAAGVIRGGNFVSQYVVGTSPDAKYQTVQAAITAAAAAGGNRTVIIKPGTYTENLVLSSTVNLRGTGYTGVTISGVHTPPATGVVLFQNITFTSATHIISSAVAGSASITFDDCIFNTTNGYIFNIANWTGPLTIYNCADIGANSGVLNNTGGASVEFANANLGVGTGQTLTYAGGLFNMDSVDVGCPVSIGTGATFTARVGGSFTRTFTTANNSTANIAGCYFGTGATAAISHGSSGTFILSSSTINSSNNPSIAGAGAGVMTITGVDFVSNSSISGTLTVAGGIIRGGNFVTQLVVGPAPDAKYQTVQAAVTAAGATAAMIFIKPGTYTENVTFVAGSNIEIWGSGYFNTILTGVHVPPASGSLLFRSIFLTSATHVLSSAAAGSATLFFDDCVFNLTNGYIFNTLNWTGSLSINDSGDLSTINGILNNTGGSPVEISLSTLGAGTGQTLTYAGGNITIEACDINCPSTFGTGAALTANMSNTFTHTLTTTGNAGANITNAYFSTGSTAAISHGSSGKFTLSNSVILSGNNPSIDGAGAGALLLTDMSFISNAVISGTLTVSYGSSITGDTYTYGSLELPQASTHYGLKGGAVTDFIGTGTLALGSATILKTNITTGDRVFIERTSINGSTALGVFSYSILANTSLTITSLNPTTAATETNDTSNFTYFIVRQL